jgi:hypothetical protein
MSRASSATPAAAGTIQYDCMAVRGAARDVVT